jgi:response regulator aspartate phosphatase C
MSIEVMPSYQIVAELNEMYESLLEKDFNKSYNLKETLQDSITETNYESMYNYWSLLNEQLGEIQESTEHKDLIEALPSINEDSSKKEEDSNRFLDYYYHFFKGMQLCRQYRYEEALQYYQIVEGYLEFFHNTSEKPDFYYQTGSVFYQLNLHAYSISYVLKSLEFAENKANVIKHRACCKILLGANYTDILEYNQAEEYYKQALEEASEIEDGQLQYITHHNLGFLFSVQDKSLKALYHLKLSAQWLEENQNWEYLCKTLYLISKEYTKLPNADQAVVKNWMAKGYKACKKGSNQLFLYRLNILKADFDKDCSNYEKSLKEGVDHFYREQYWEYVDEYGEKLANYYREKQEYQQAVLYYQYVIEAKKKRSLKERERK